MRCLYFCMLFSKNSLSLVLICEKGRKIAKKINFLIFGDLAPQDWSFAPRESLWGNWCLRVLKSRCEVVNEVRDFRGRYLSIRSDRRNLRKRSGKSIFAPQRLADLWHYKIQLSIPWFRIFDTIQSSLFNQIFLAL